MESDNKMYDVSNNKRFIDVVNFQFPFSLQLVAFGVSNMEDWIRI